MKDKDLKKEDERQENKKQAEIFKMMVEQGTKTDEEKFSKSKAKHLELQRLIKMEMADKDGIKGKKKQMNANEVKMNNALLKNMGKELYAKKTI